MRTLQAELRALDPLMDEAESVMVRQAGQGVFRATALTKAALAPALLETAGKSERFAYEKLGAEQRERVGIQKVRIVPTLTVTLTRTRTLTLALALTPTLALALTLTLTKVLRSTEAQLRAVQEQGEQKQRRIEALA